MIRKSVDVFCNVCSSWIHGGVDCSISYAREIARKEGWIYKKGEDICPYCQKDIIKENAENISQREKNF